MLKACSIRFLSPLADTSNDGSLSLWWQPVFKNVFEKTKFPKIRIFSSFVYQRRMWEKAKKKYMCIENR